MPYGALRAGTSGAVNQCCKKCWTRPRRARAGVRTARQAERAPGAARPAYCCRMSEGALLGHCVCRSKRCSARRVSKTIESTQFDCRVELMPTAYTMLALRTPNPSHPQVSISAWREQLGGRSGKKVPEPAPSARHQSHMSTGVSGTRFLVRARAYLARTCSPQCGLGYM